MHSLITSRPRPDRSLLIFTHGAGRLGNQLLSHAHLLAFCLQHAPRFSLLNIALYPYRSFLPRDAEVFGIFPSTALSSLARLVATTGAIHLPRVRTLATKLSLELLYAVSRSSRHTARIAAPDASGFGTMGSREVGPLDLACDATVDLLGATPTVLLSGWRLRSWQLLQQHSVEIRKRMALRASGSERISQDIAALRRDCDMLIGVHIRRGDYVHWFQGRYLFEPKRYAQWMHDLVRRFSDRGRVGFLVCAEEPVPAEVFSELSVHQTLDHAYGGAARDLIRLSCCDLIVMPPSTFGAWASFMGRVPILLLRANDMDIMSEPILENGIFDTAVDHDLSNALR